MLGGGPETAKRHFMGTGAKRERATAHSGVAPFVARAPLAFVSAVLRYGDTPTATGFPSQGNFNGSPKWWLKHGWRLRLDERDETAKRFAVCTMK